MVNIGGYRNYMNSVGTKHYDAVKPHAKGDKDDKKPVNTDRADFSSLLDNAVSGKDEGLSDMKIGSVSEKTDKLSETAQNYLEKLKEKYPDMDFIISDYSSDEEADALLAKGKGKYNVLITPALLEKMAADENVAAEYEGIIDKSVSDIETAKEKLGEDSDMVESYGITVNADGEVSIRARLIEGMLGDGEDRTIKATTIDELLGKLNEIREAQAEKLAEIRAKRTEKAEKAEEKKDEAAEKVSFEAEA